MTASTAKRSHDTGGHEAARERRATPHRERTSPPFAAAGNQALQQLYGAGTVRAKLRVGSPDDPAEREADAMADAALGQASCSCRPGEPPCPRCRAMAASNVLRRKPRSASTPAPPNGVALGSGRPLDHTSRRFFEARYGTDLSSVRIHTGDHAAASAADLDARAFTLGQRIAFGRDEYRPDCADGRRLLAHELAHVVQHQHSAEATSIHRQTRSPSRTPAQAHCTAATIELPNRIVFSGNRGAVSATVSTDLHAGDYWISYAPASGQYRVSALGYTPTERPHVSVSSPHDRALMEAYRDSVTREGVRLHVAGEKGPNAITVPDASITEQYAEELDDHQLATYADVYRTRLSTMAAGDERHAVEDNLRIIRSEQLKRQSRRITVVGSAPRPRGLPAGGGFALQPASSLPQHLLDRIPEGRVVTLPSDLHSGRSNDSASRDSRNRFITVTPLDADLQPLSAPRNAHGGFHPSNWTTPLAAGARTMLRSINARLMQQGFAAAGPDAIGIVGIPRVPSPGAWLPEAFDIWGHTAIYVRQGGRITMVRGFGPDMSGPRLFSFLRRSRGVEAGTDAVPAVISEDAHLFTVTGARSIEYPVSSDLAANLAGRMPEVGAASDVGVTPSIYTARPAVYQVCEASNCVLWSVEQAEEALGGNIGPASKGVSVTALGDDAAITARSASQGRLIRFMRAVQEGEDAIAPEAALSAPVAANMSRGLQVIKWGGRAFFVIGLATIPVEVYLAPPEQRVRTAVGATAGFAGGFAGGALAGLVCGPGAPVCSVVLGISFGLAGAYGARTFADTIYDSAKVLYHHPDEILAPPSATTLAFHGGYAGLLRSPADVMAEMRRQRAMQAQGRR